jgi:hypothetical protein
MPQVTAGVYETTARANLNLTWTEIAPSLTAIVDPPLSRIHSTETRLAHWVRRITDVLSEP